MAVFTALMSAACGGRTRPAAADKPAGFPYVEVPVSIAAPAERAAYASAHWWDGFDFSDTSLVNRPEVTEQGFADFVMVLGATGSYDTARGALRKMYARAEPYPAMWEYLVELGEKYFYDPNSPLRDDELYIAVLEAQTESRLLSDAEKTGPRGRLEMASKNRVGERAADFGFVLADGRPSRLYDIKADYTVLFFYNLGCAACKDVREQLMRLFSEEGTILARMYSEGKLKVAAVYPDEDMTEWDRYEGDIPRRWINGYDRAQNINRGALYDLRAIPTLYLLGKDKTVLLKDIPDAGRIAEYVTYDTVYR